MTDRCKHELMIGTCAVCLGTDRTPVPDPFEGVSVKELDPEFDLGTPKLPRSGGEDE